MKDIRSREYYEKCFDKRLELTDFLKKSLSSQSYSDDLKKSKVALGYISNLLSLTIIKFSKGDNKEELQEYFPVILSLLEEYWHPNLVRMKTGSPPNLVYVNIYYLNYYFIMRWLLSFSVLLDLDIKYFNLLEEKIKRDSIQDTLYDVLLSYKKPKRIISDKMSIKKPHNRIGEISLINNKEECQKEIEKYLKNEWYKTYKNDGLYNSHKKPEEDFAFYGYWAFEVAAIVKLKKLNHSSFKNHKYYPDRLL